MEANKGTASKGMYGGSVSDKGLIALMRRAPVPTRLAESHPVGEPNESRFTLRIAGGAQTMRVRRHWRLCSLEDWVGRYCKYLHNVASMSVRLYVCIKQGNNLAA